MPALQRLALAALTFLPLACNTTADGSDTTPPELTFYCRVDDGLWTEIPVTGDSLTVGRTQTLWLWANAHDPGGVEITIVSATGSQSCSSPVGPTLSTFSMSETALAAPGTGVGDSTESSRNVVLEIDLNELCDSGVSTGTTFTARAFAQNFTATGGVDSGELEVTVD